MTRRAGGGRRPPRLARWLLSRLLPVDHRNEAIGDLDEEYLRHVSPRAGRLAARAWYWRQALSSIPTAGSRLLVEAGADVRYGLRAMRNQPGFTAAAVLLLALGIGATTAMFSIVNAALLRALPYPHAEQLVRLVPARPGAEQHRFTFSEGEFLTYEERATSLQALAAYESEVSAALVGEGGPIQVQGARATANLFAVLGVDPVLGRGFTVAEDRPGGPPVVVISHALWQQMFGADANVIGRTVDFDARPTTVVGVMPAGFHFPDRTAAFWTPLALDRVDVGYQSGQILRVVGRRQSAVTHDRVQQDLDRVSAQITDEALTRYPGMSARVVGMRAEQTGAVRTPLLLLLAVVAVVLLLVCFNLAGFLIAQGVARGRELAVRRALGASAGRIVRQLMSESALLAAAGGAAGVSLAWATVRLVNAMQPAFLDGVGEIPLDLAVLAAALGATTASALLFGLAPAWAATRPRAAGVLRAGRAVRATPAAQRFLSGLVLVQIAACVVLLVGAGLMLQTLARETAVDPGFTVEGTLSFSIALPRSRYADVTATNAFFGAALEEIRALPFVEQAGAITIVPMSGERSMGYAWQEGKAVEPGAFPQELNMRWATPSYFNAMGIELLSGQTFDASHAPGRPLVAVLSRSLAEALWPGEDAVGKRFKLGRQVDATTPWRTVIGVAEEVRSESLRDRAAPTVYFAASQRRTQEMDVVVRLSSSAGVGGTSAAGTADIVAAVRAAVARVDPAQPIHDVRPLRELVAHASAMTRASATLLGAFALLALLLAAVGLYALIAYSIRQRFHEIGIRRALGATGSDVLALVMSRAGRLTAAGIAVGILGTFVAARFLDSMVFGVATTDPVTLAVTCGAVALIALVASVVPARRAIAIGPGESLKS